MTNSLSNPDRNRNWWEETETDTPPEPGPMGHDDNGDLADRIPTET